MKKSKKILSLVLAVILTVSCLGISAFAATEETVKKVGEGGYVVLGDSVARGCGACEDYTTTGHYYDYDYRVVQGAYPYLLARELGCDIVDYIKDSGTNNYWPICANGQPLSAVMDLLGIEDDFTDDAYTLSWEAGGFGDRYEIMKELYSENAEELLANADVITIGLGMVDVYWRAVVLADREAESPSADWLKALVKYYNEGYDYWLRAYPLLIEYLQSINDHASIVIVGAYNVGGDLRINDDSILPVGMGLAISSGKMNAQYREWADKYGVLFADISNVETYAQQNDFSFMGDEFWENTMRAGHPSVEGHAYICRQILNVLPKEDPVVQEATTDIKVDLGRFDKVDYVILNGIKLNKSQYSMDGYELIIPNKSKLCANLTVAVVNGKKVSVYTYQLAYHCDSGYSAYLIYGADDAAKTATTAVKSVFSVGSRLASAVGSLLKK